MRRVLSTPTFYLEMAWRKVVPVSTIPGFFPKNRKDFNKQQVNVWWLGKGDNDDYLYNANVLLLGSKYL